MTGLEKIVKQIRDEAAQSASEVIAQAKEEAAAYTAEAQKQAKADCAAIAAQAKTAAEAASTAAKSAADLAVRREVLSAKQQIISEVIADAQQSIRSLPDKEYFDLILKMAAKFSLPQEGEIAFSAADLNRLPDGFPEALSKAAKGPLSISDTPCTIDGGFVLTYGGVEENCSLEALFYAARESLQDKVHALLFA